MRELFSPPGLIKYCSLEEVRGQTNIQSGEFSDAHINSYIRQATSEIDSKTHRTWRGKCTVTDELYDGDGCNVLFLNQTDLSSVISLSIKTDDEPDTAFTPITIANYVFTYTGKNDGYIILDSNAEVPNFTAGRQTVKISYVFGAMCSTQLNGALSSSTTTVSVDSTTGFPSVGFFAIDNELVSYTGLTTTSFTGCTRGENGTTATTHTDDSIVVQSDMLIRQLAIDMVANKIHYDPMREREINRTIDSITWHGRRVINKVSGKHRRMTDSTETMLEEIGADDENEE